MTKDRKTKAVLRASILLAIGCFIACTAGCSQPERFQLMANESNPCVIDTVSGRAWPTSSGVFKSIKPVKESGQIGRFKGVVIGKDNYIIDTVTGQVWTPSSGVFRSPKDHLK